MCSMNRETVEQYNGYHGKERSGDPQSNCLPSLLISTLYFESTENHCTLKITRR